MTRLRPFIGPLIVGVAAWCALGHITVLSSDSAAARLAVPASSTWLFLAIGIAALVPAWRRDPRLALPALLSTLPWWPVPLPAIALMWTGPLAWVPIAMALIVAYGSGPLRQLIRAAPASFFSDPRRATIAAGLATLILSAVVAWRIAPHTDSGDEPHYLAIAESLLKDGDLRIENNHADPSFITRVGKLKPDYRATSKHGEIYSIHAPGLPVIILPVYAWLGYAGAQAMVILMAAFTGALVWRTGWRATDDSSAAWFAWAAAIGSVTFLIQSATVFPDLPGALAVAGALLLLVSLVRDPSAVRSAPIVWTSVLLAMLPWMHTRFAVLAVGLGGLIAWRLWKEARPVAERRARLIALLAVPAFSALAWFAYFQLIYGTPSPTAPYGVPDDTSVFNIPGALIAMFLDGQFGLLAYAPLLAIGCVAAWRGSATPVRTASRQALGVALLYLAGVAVVWMWWAGIPAPPARFLTAILPVLALPIALAWANATDGAKRGLLTLLVISLSISTLLIGVDRGALAWNDRTAQPLWLEWLGPVVNLPRGWPSFFLVTPVMANHTTEIPFVLHAIAWAGTLGLAGLVALSRQRADGPPQRSRLTFAVAAILGTMAAVQIGWWMTRSDGLDPARSQVAALSASHAGGSSLEIGPWGAHRSRDAVRAVTIRTEEPSVKNEGAGPALVLSAVPAGTYELRFFSSHPRIGTAFVRLDRGPVPLRSLPLLPLPEQSAVISLPAGAASLTVATDPPLPGLRVDVVPVQLDADQGPPAVSAARYGDLDVFFVDDHTFAPEPDGFWVRGGQAAEIVVAARDGRDVVHLELSNGLAANSVTVTAGGFDRTLSLKPSETKGIDVTFANTGATLRVRVSSPAGFRPSEQSGSTDSRYLGVRVTLR